MRPRDFAGLALLGAVWGAAFLFIRVAVPALGPFLLVGLRVGLAAATLSLYALAAGRVPKIRSRWRSFLILGFFNAALPFSLISTAEIHLTASLAAILNSTTVMFTAIVAAVWMGDALTARKLVGIVLGIVGVTVLVGWDPTPVNGVVLLSVAAMLVASLSYALGATYAKSSF
jgi:drug/metabolite transporter (DMT)-like permease